MNETNLPIKEGFKKIFICHRHLVNLIKGGGSRWRGERQIDCISIYRYNEDKGGLSYDKRFN